MPSQCMSVEFRAWFWHAASGQNLYRNQDLALFIYYDLMICHLRTSKINYNIKNISAYLMQLIDNN